MLSVVVPTFNEGKNIRNLVTQIDDALKGIDYEILFVDDSKDNTPDVIREVAKDFPQIRLEHRTAETGLATAVLKGFELAKGEYMACMDADLQHPPQCIPDIIQKFEDGYEVVSMIRTQNEDAGFIKRFTSAAFYKVLNMLSPVKFEDNSSDFFALSNSVAEVLRNDYREKIRYLRGYVQSVGFEKTTLEFSAGKRTAGESKYNIKKLIKFSINALCSFSDLPLKLGIYSGCGVAFLGFILMVYTIINKFINHVPAGYSTIIVVLCFMFAVTLIVIGIIGEYIAILFAEVKDRPIYIVREVINDNKDN